MEDAHPSRRRQCHPEAPHGRTFALLGAGLSESEGPDAAWVHPVQQEVNHLRLAASLDSADEHDRREIRPSKVLLDVEKRRSKMLDLARIGGLVDLPAKLGSLEHPTLHK